MTTRTIAISRMVKPLCVPSVQFCPRRLRVVTLNMAIAESVAVGPALAKKEPARSRALFEGKFCRVGSEEARAAAVRFSTGRTPVAAIIPA